MERKWDRINENKLYKQDRYLIIEKLLKKKIPIKDIIEQLPFSRRLIYKVKNELEKNN